MLRCWLTAAGSIRFRPTVPVASRVSGDACLVDALDALDVLLTSSSESGSNSVSKTEPEGPVGAGSTPAPTDLGPWAIPNDLLGAFLSLLPDAGLLVNGEGVVVAANDQAAPLFGYPEGALVGRSIDMLVPERMRRRHQQRRVAYAAGPERRALGAALDLVGRRRDGHEFPVDISLAPISSAGASLVVAAVRDVTDQRAATAVQAQLAAIVISSFDAIISADLQGIITSWNPAAEALFGYVASECVGLPIATLVPADASLGVEDLLEAATAGESRGALDTRWRHRAGYEVDVAVSISTLRTNDGARLGFSMIVRDVRARKKAEKELRRVFAQEQRLEHQHAATSEIRLALLSGASLTDSLMLICHHGSVLLDASALAICVKDHDDLRVIAASGVSPDVVGTAHPARGSFEERVLESGRHVQVAVRTDVVTRVVVPLFPEGPTLAVPVIAEDDTVAVLTVARAAGASAFGAVDLLVAEGLAAQIAFALGLEGARQDREQMMLLGDRERIARDLHDHVIQQLFATGISLQGILPLIDGDVATIRVSDAIDSLDDTIREIRSTIYDISRALSGDLGLKSRLVELVRSAELTLGFTPSIRFDGAVEAGVPDMVVPHILAAVREGLSNIARHAEARSASVRVAIVGDDIQVTVVDDGVGAKDPGRWSGLGNLEERARLLGGRFELSLPAGGGTRLDWLVPLRAVDQPVV
jgi:PAS domain S-box-containing protein